MDPKHLHLVMLPSFASGDDISSFVHLSNKLASHGHGGLRISFVSTSSNVPNITKILIPSPNTQIVPLTLPDVLPGLHPVKTSGLNPIQSQLLDAAMDLIQPQIKTLLSQLNPNFVVFDSTLEWLPKLASDIGIKTCFFSDSTALSTAFLAVPARGNNPSLDQLKLPPPGFPKTSITSIKTYEARNLISIYKSYEDHRYDAIVSSMTSSSVIITKTSSEMEGPYIDYLKSQYKKPVLTVGPIPITPSPTDNDPLDENFANSVAKWELEYMANTFFMISDTLDNTIEDLATGIELTGLPFILNITSDIDLKKALPEGFTERVKDRGIVVTGLGQEQQQKILAHPNVVCYFSHGQGGLSSVMGAIVNGCQVVMLPQKGDEFLTAKLVSEEMGVGIQVKRRDEDGRFGKEDVKDALESVMIRVSEEPGKSIRENHKKWKVLLSDEGFERKLIGDFVKELEGIAFEP